MLMQTADGLYGPGGSTTESDGARSTIKLVAGKVDTAELYFLAQPKGGTATVTADGDVSCSPVETAADARSQAGVGRRADPRRRQRSLEIKATKGHNAAVPGSISENARGAVVDNLGVVSVNVKSFANNDAQHWTAELGHRGADLGDDHDRRERGRVARSARSGHQGLSSAHYEQGARDRIGAARPRRDDASSCRRPIRPRQRTARIRRAR